MKKAIPFLLFVVLLVAASLFLPYRGWLEKRLELILASKGFENVTLTISSLGFKSAVLENVSVGAEDKLNLKNITLEYSLPDLWKGNLRDLALSGVNVDIRQAGERWIVTGLEGWGRKPESNISQPFAVPVTLEQLSGIPFERIRLEDSLLNVTFDKGKLFVPLDMAWRKAPKPEFTYKGNNLSFMFNDLEMTAGNLSVDAYIEQDSRKWSGPWALQGLTTAGTSIPVPVMNGAGNVLIDGEHGQISGKMESDDRSWRAAFDMNYNFTAPEKSDLTIIHAGMPWKDGRIDVRNVRVPLEGKKPVRLDLQVKSVSIQELMQSLTGDRVSATGRVSGTLPVAIGRDGSIKVLPGNLKSEGPGTISMPPYAIPGNDEQVSLVRKILEDLRYSGLTIAVQNDKDGQLGILMTFEGNNPAVYNGRPVKLNVNLTGDILDFIQQNILFLTNPEQFLKQGYDEKN